MLKVIFKLRNIRRAPGDAGVLKRIVESVNETDTDFFVQRNGTVNRWPGSMQIVVCINFLVLLFDLTDDGISFYSMMLKCHAFGASCLTRQTYASALHLSILSCLVGAINHT